MPSPPDHRFYSVVIATKKRLFTLLWSFWIVVFASYFTKVVWPVLQVWLVSPPLPMPSVSTSRPQRLFVWNQFNHQRGQFFGSAFTIWLFQWFKDSIFINKKINFIRKYFIASLLTVTWPPQPHVCVVRPQDGSFHDARQPFWPLHSAS